MQSDEFLLRDEVGAGVLLMSLAWEDYNLVYFVYTESKW